VVPADELQQLLRGADLRVTRPRLAVLDAVHATPHADTESLIRAARVALPTVSHQAVYDVLRVLTDAGLVRRIQPAGSVVRYEARVGDNPCLTPSGDHAFSVDEAEVTYWGLCPACSPART
jgi:Fe2+ or Zn2+ uptake regulation protein